MTQDEIEEAIAFQAHEMGTDAANRTEAMWLCWVRDVEKLYGHHIDGDEGDGVCLDAAAESFERGETPAEYLNGRKYLG